MRTLRRGCFGSFGGRVRPAHRLFAGFRFSGCLAADHHLEYAVFQRFGRQQLVAGVAAEGGEIAGGTGIGGEYGNHAAAGGGGQRFFGA